MTNKQLENYVNCICNIKLKDGTKYTRKRVYKVGEIFVIKGTIDKQLKVSEIKSIEKVIVDTTATYDNYVYEKIEEHIKKVSKRNIKTNQICVSFVVKYSGKFTIARSFETLEEAREFKRICEENIRKHKLTESINNTKENVIDENQLLEYPETLLKELEITQEEYSNYYTEIVPNFDDNFKTACEKVMLNEREIGCLLSRYKDLFSLEEIGKKYGITRERVRQIIIKSIKKIKSVKSCFINGKDKLELINKQEREQLLQEIRDQLTKDVIKEQLLKLSDEEIKETLVILNNEFAKRKEEEHKKSHGFYIEDLDFSVRTYNCLKRYGINDLYELQNMTIEDLMKVRNLGKKSVKEIKNKLLEMGIELKESNWY